MADIYQYQHETEATDRLTVKYDLASCHDFFINTHSFEKATNVTIYVIFGNTQTLGILQLFWS
jgi:hypothetical protein